MFLLIAVWAFCINISQGINEAEILKRFEGMENREMDLRRQLQTQAKEMENMRATVADQQEKIIKLELACLAKDFQTSIIDDRGQYDPTVDESNFVKQVLPDEMVKSIEHRSQKRFVFSPPEMPVAFSAFKNANLGSVNANQNIVFDSILINEGNGYHSNHGLFIAPQSGIYFFTITLLHPNQPTPVHAEVIRNGTVIARLHSESNQYEQTSQSLIANVNTGEEIYVVNRDYANEVYTTGLYSSFSGFLIWAS
ncbi:complement C1q tumor necrosis factor-related protein 3-like isoform X1 [Mya arenaria]|uniref:complement C1q tumor necrosis factor-related protein 3-like isoform X1 n=1 Tax=Mya arenaria TaxID=6604 RepID=UPI0022E1C3F5|nr:complement C1q tumor necrosis factor-related protein 3-like isoform X1 [Mya arenaria]